MTRLPAWTALLCLVAAALAGCAANAPAPAPTATAPPPDPVNEKIGQQLVAATDDNATIGVDTPFLMTAPTGPDSPLTAFRWRIPEGAIIHYKPIPDFSDFVINEVVFEVVPVVPNGTQVDQFALLTVALDKEATLMETFIGESETGSYSENLLTTGSISDNVSLTPRFLSVYIGDLEEGDTLAFVLTAHSAAPSSVGWLMRDLAERPGDRAEPAQDAAHLLREKTAVVLSPIGRGAGFQDSFYLSSDFTFPPYLIEHFEVRAGPVAVTDALPRVGEPVATSREVTVSASFPKAGHSESVAEAIDFPVLTEACPAAGTYDIAIDLHGTTVADRGLITGAPLAIIALGLPVARGVGDGAGEARTTLKVTKAEVGCGFVFIDLSQIDLGATLQDLVGVPSAVGASSLAGLVGNVPPTHMWSEGGDLMLYSGGRLMVRAGAGHVADLLPTAPSEG